MPRAHPSAARQVTRSSTRSPAPASSSRGLGEAAVPVPQPPPAERAAIEDARPAVDCGKLPAKATAGLPLTVSAACFIEGHGLVMAWIRHGPAEVLGDQARSEAPGGARSAGLGNPVPGWEEVRMQPVGNDRFTASFTPPRVGAWAYQVGAMPDDFGTWLRDLRSRLGAGQDVALDLEGGARMAERNAARLGSGSADRSALARLAARLRDGAASPVRRLAEAAGGDVVELMRRTADRGAASVSGPWPLTVERELAGFSAWYEMFPRSEGALPPRSGTFRTASRRLGAIASMGFDVVYLPPIHPIGRSFRRGPNNTPDPGPHDVGSPWAIGAAEGGHTSVHPDLGTLEDFRRFLAEASAHRLEVALDYALNCSPDHPWVEEHPEWFQHRADGSIRHAENPPKQYRDIYPLDFETRDRAGLWAALRDVMLFWVDQGVRVFRVDNPHTKPFAFWQWLIAEVRRRNPEIVWLAEAFTRPAVMQRLAKIGFSQSYTYFTWRNSKPELSEYLTELSRSELADWFRPNFWVNTPDILHAYLQQGGPSAFRVRATLAAMTAPSWGMYSGFELFENQAVSEGSEEYLDSEKYQLRPRIWDRSDSLAPYITRLNRIRRLHREAIALLPTLRLHEVKNDSMLCVSRMSQARDDVLLLVINLDPHHVQEATTWLDLESLGIPANVAFEAVDELTGATYSWRGPENYVRLDPAQQAAHVLSLRRR